MLKKKFRFKLSPAGTLLCAVDAAAGAAGAAFSAVEFVKGVEPNGAIYAQNPVLSAVLVFVCVALSTGSLSVFFSAYTVSESGVTCKVGIIKTFYPPEKISGATEFKKSGKFVLYFTDNTFTVVVIKKEEYAEFAAALKAIKPDMVIDETSEK